MNTPSSPLPSGADGLDDLLDLPQPLHLFEYLTRSGHYHYGCFEAGGSLEDALERMASLAASRLGSGAGVLDVGCGLGGTAALLANRGFDVLALDPCVPCIRYARARYPGLSARFVEAGFRQYSLASESPRFDNLLFIEVLQHFPDLPEFFCNCQALLREGGKIVFLDVALVPHLPWLNVPCHPLGALAKAARGAGLRLLERNDLTAQTLPTLPALLELVSGSREYIRAHLTHRRPRILEELEELETQMRRVLSAFEAGELVFECTVFERPSANGHAPAPQL